MSTRHVAEDCLNLFCEKSINRAKGHTPKSILTLAKFFMKLGDYRVASEVLWGCASLTIQMAIGNSFYCFETCHSAYYTDGNNASDVNVALVKAQDFIKQLKVYQLTDEKRIELESTNFDY
ncbi:unnamed protein product [Auanema sp. JU1783]|nr:unnamed protein product [Auanema sp. JU1783]